MQGMGAGYTQDIAFCFTDAIGGGGLSREAFAALLGETEAGLVELRAGRRAGSPAFLRLPQSSEAWRALEATARRLAHDFERVIVMGIGGSSLGAQTFAALKPNPRLIFLENVDPSGFVRALGEAPEDAAILAVSKSGETMETLSLLLAAIAVLERSLRPEQLRRQILVLTQPGDSPLARVAEAKGFERIEHAPDLGGRYSAFSAVGLIPALIAGLDARALVAGAGGVLEALERSTAPSGFAPAEGAAMAIGLMRTRALALSVLMPYRDALFPFAQWYRQLWAESLGKDGKGSTPIAARGTLDQHSELQLYLAGPADKFFTLIAARSAGEGAELPSALAERAGLGYLGGHRLGDVLAAEFEATAEALIAAGRPVRKIEIERLDEEGLGALMMHFMLETVLSARLLGVEPFGQPAVEEGKARARAKLARGRS